MDRNLGAARSAQHQWDGLSFGSYFQWGRFADGHQCNNSMILQIQATTSIPDLGNVWDGKFIIHPDSENGNNWLTPKNDNLWQGVDGDNNPCPNSYRPPTHAEWNAEIGSWATKNAFGAYGSSLKWSVGGVRTASGSFSFTSSHGEYWTSTVSGIYSKRIAFHDGGVFANDAPRANGYPIRCIKD